MLFLFHNEAQTIKWRREAHLCPGWKADLVCITESHNVVLAGDSMTWKKTNLNQEWHSTDDSHSYIKDRKIKIISVTLTVES